MKSNLAICKLIKYAQKYLGLHPADATYTTNTILDILGISYFEQVPVEYVTDDIAELLGEFVSACVEDGIFEEPFGPYYCDRVMGALSLLPSAVDGVFQQIRAEQVKGKFDFVVCRAVTDMNDFAPWVQGKISNTNKHALQNGILCLKGGDLQEELKPFGDKATVYDLNKFFNEEFYETKKVVHLTFQK